MLVHAELLTFLNLCGSSVACSPPSPPAVPPVSGKPDSTLSFLLVL